jgi:DNA-binding CsgD family transcriptional regulator
VRTTAGVIGTWRRRTPVASKNAFAIAGTDLTQREIGEALYVSFNTVKTHVKSIFRKLNVATRPDAVSRARELRLL